jgi:hypothetical protein
MIVCTKWGLLSPFYTFLALFFSYFKTPKFYNLHYKKDKCMRILLFIFLLMPITPIFSEIEKVIFIFPTMEKAKQEKLILHLSSYHGVKKIIDIKNQKNLSICVSWNNNVLLSTKTVANVFVGYPLPLLYISGHAKFSSLGTTGVFYLYSEPDKSSFFLEEQIGKKIAKTKKLIFYFRGVLDLREDILHLIDLREYTR